MSSFDSVHPFRSLPRSPPNSFVSKAARGEDGDGGLSALCGCCRQPGNPAVAKLLLDAGARVDAPRWHGWGA